MVSLKSRNGGSTWTPEEVEMLTAMVREGKSAGVIAQAISRHSRNSVIGKTSRLGLKRPGSRTLLTLAKPKAKAKPRRPLPPPVPQSGATSKPLMIETKVEDIVWISEDDHKDGMCLCRGDDRLMCSGRRQEVEVRGRRFLSSWCEAHRKVFTVADRPHRRK